MLLKLLKNKPTDVRVIIVVLLICVALRSYAQSDLVPYRKGSKWGYCNSQKQMIIRCKYDSADVFYDCNRAFVKMKGKYGFIDGKGKLVIPARYEAVGFFRSQYGQDCKAWVTLKCKTMWVDTNGALATQPKKFAVDEFNTFTGAGIIFEQNGKKGLRSEMLNDTGGSEIILPPIYDDLLDDGNALLAKLNGKWGMLNYQNFKISLPLEYEAIKRVYSYYLLSGQNGLFGIADKYGNILIPVKYRRNIQIIDGKRFVKVQTPNGKVGYVGFGGMEYFDD